MPGYSADLAYIHDVGFSDYAAEAGPGVLDLLRRSGMQPGGLIVDLGCGSGVWASRLAGEGYSVIGVDISASMLELARANAPGATFEQGSLFDYRPPKCDAVTCLGECINYCFAGNVGTRDLDRLFRRIYRALRPGGVFLFDFAEPGGIPNRQFHRVGKDWAVLVDAVEKDSRLTRRIASFRANGGSWRRTDETHVQRLFEKDAVVELARTAGFSVRTSRQVGGYPLPPAHLAVIARKRARRSTPVNA
jgi:SAM-dependent methyltransferase